MVLASFKSQTTPQTTSGVSIIRNLAVTITSCVSIAGCSLSFCRFYCVSGAEFTGTSGIVVTSVTN